MNHYIIDTNIDETKLFEEISLSLRQNGVAASCVLDDVIEVEASKNATDAIAEGTGRFIIENLEESKVYEILKSNGINNRDAEGAAKYFKEDTFNRCSRLRVLKKELNTALSDYGRLNVEGLLNFRLYEYNHLLYTSCAMALDDYLSNKACEEFLNLLKYYVDIQDSRCKSVTVTCTDNDYLITDENGNLIDEKEDEDFFDGVGMSQLPADDVLIGRLMNIAPENIVVLGGGEKTVIKTLKKIFEDRLKILN